MPEASKLIKSKKLSPAELTNAYIGRVKSLDGELHSFLLLLEDAAMADEKKAETEIAAGVAALTEDSQSWTNQ